jgi:putative transposase
MTFTSLYFHVIFSTKYRLPQIRPEWSERLHEYFGGTLRNNAGSPIATGGVDDHVHLLFGMKPTVALSDLIRDVKRAASHWVHDIIGDPNFAWQEGYAAFTVSPDAVENVKGYVLNQAVRHGKIDFRKELTTLLDAAGVPYKEEYLD